MLVPRTDMMLRCRWFLRGPDNVLYETEYRESSTDETQGEILCRYTLWQYGGNAPTEPPRLEWRQTPSNPLRHIRLNTLPAWWREPRDMEARCAAWEAMTPANPLPEGWCAPLVHEGRPVKPKVLLAPTAIAAE